MSLLILMVFCTNGIVEYTDTQSFQPLMKEEVRVDSSGAVYVLSFSESLISIYAPDGTLTTRIGGKGNGPGELTYPVDFWVVDGHIFVFDIQNTMVSQFDTQGEFINRWSAPARNVKLVKIEGGWFYGDWGMFATSKLKKDIVWSDDTFSESIVVCQVDDLGFTAGLRTYSTDTENKGIYSPFDNRPLLVASWDQSRVYLTNTQSFRIRILDAETKSVSGEITKSVSKLPFDEEWAETKFINTTEASMRNSFSWTKNYPKYFPPIRSLNLSADGHLVINRWRGDPDNQNYFMTLTPTGEEVERDWDMNYLNRLVGRYKSWVYITTWDDQKQEAGVIRLPSKDAESFVANVPIEYDGPTGRSISISF